MVLAIVSSLLLLSFFSFFSSAQQNDDDLAAHARAELSTILGKTSAWQTDFNTYDSYSELSEDIGKKHFLLNEDKDKEQAIQPT